MFSKVELTVYIKQSTHDASGNKNSAFNTVWFR